METKKKLRKSIDNLEHRLPSWQGSFDTLYDFMWMTHRFMEAAGYMICETCRGRGRYTIIRGRNEPGRGQECKICEGKGFVRLESDEPVKFNITPREE